MVSPLEDLLCPPLLVTPFNLPKRRGSAALRPLRRPHFHGLFATFLLFCAFNTTHSSPCYQQSFEPNIVPLTEQLGPSSSACRHEEERVVAIMQ